MAFGLSAPGLSPEYHGPEARFRTLTEYRQLMRDVVRPGAGRHHADERQQQRDPHLPRAAVRRKLYYPCRPRQRCDRHLARGGHGPLRHAALPTVPHGNSRPRQCDKSQCRPEERRLGADLGLYSVTLNNDVQRIGKRWKPTRHSAWRPRPRVFAISSKSSIPTPPRIARPTWGGSSPTTSCGCWRACQPRPAGLPQDRLSRPGGHGGSGRLRSSLVVGILGGSAGTALGRLPHALGGQEIRRRARSTAGRSTTPNTS